ncbi:unnamed protein product [Thlaspi arvense]|uniref:Uncharacterized protein n=1 Tax=Thlaspi arvense TaxID=13288 RepID=A0AAU9RWP8_THLAR|nr:unnamed protein product [Thlaspi arvense]
MLTGFNLVAIFKFQLHLVKQKRIAMEDTHDESLDLQEIRSEETGESSPSSDSGNLVHDFALQLEMSELESQVEEKSMIFQVIGGSGF